MKILKILISFLSSCEKKEKYSKEIGLTKTANDSLVKIENDSKFDLDDFIIDIDADKEDFIITKRNDTIFIQKVLYKTLDNAVLRFKKSIILTSLNEDLVIGFKQYTIDDNPASSLDININKNIKYKENKPYRFLSSKEISNWLFSKYFNKIKNESLKFQKNFYQKLLKDKSKYTKCCPEYIKQAEVF